MFAESLNETIKTNAQYRWPGPAAWCVNAKNEYLAQAAEFLKEKQLLPANSSMEKLASQWPTYVSGMFNAEKSREFYESWKGSAGASGIAANITDQFGRIYLPYALGYFLGPGYRGNMLDFGCGTAGVSIMWRRDFAPEAKLLLADVANLSRDLTLWHAGKYGTSAVSITGIGLEDIPDNSIDALMCIHVLEHLPNPSEVFGKLIPKIRTNGFLFVEAPWGGHPEHLEEAPLDWVKNGGRDMLEDFFVRAGNLDLLIPVTGRLSGVFRRDK